MFRKQDLTQMGFLLHFVFFLPIKNVLSCLDGEDMSLCLYVAFITSCHFILLICSPIPIVTPVNFTFLFSPLRLSFNVEDLCCFEARKIFRFSVQKSIPMRVLRGVCRKFRSIWKQYSNFFYLLFLSWGKKPKLYLATHYLKLCWRFIKYFFKLDYIRLKQSYSTHMQRAVQ